jgi:hypothetical protein
VKVPPSSSDLGKANIAGETPTVTILVISLSPAQDNLESDWAEVGAEVILRRCPIWVEDSIVGHGRRRKQAHDQHHDWIGIRRGVCNRCGKTFTFLPPFSPPYCLCPSQGYRQTSAWNRIRGASYTVIRFSPRR